MNFIILIQNRENSYLLKFRLVMMIKSKNERTDLPMTTLLRVQISGLLQQLSIALWLSLTSDGPVNRKSFYM